MKLKRLAGSFSLQPNAPFQVLSHATHKLIKCQIVSLTHLKIYFEHVAHIKTSQPVRHLPGAMGGSVVEAVR